MYNPIPDLTPKHLARFWSNVIKSNNCWLWIGSKTSKGYGNLRIGKKMYLVHRLSFFIKHDDIDPTLTLDHLCRNPACVNPEHLEQVSLKENTLRGIAPSAQNSRKTHCPRGHPYDKIYSDNRRYCSICNKQRQKQWMKNNRKHRNEYLRKWRQKKKVVVSV